MATTAILRDCRLSAQKTRLVANQVRGLSVQRALDTLTFSNKKAAPIIHKLLNSALANAEHNDGLDVDTLRVHRIWVDEGSTYKRMQPRAKGRGCRILKRTCHIGIALVDEENERED